MKEIQKQDVVFYVCGICRAAYHKKEWAEKCEEWCETHEGTTNDEIHQNAIPLEEDSGSD